MNLYLYLHKLHKCTIVGGVALLSVRFNFNFRGHLFVVFCSALCLFWFTVFIVICIIT